MFDLRWIDVEMLLNKAEEILSVDHPLLRVIKQCLYDDPLRRPSARELVMKIRGMFNSGNTQW